MDREGFWMWTISIVLVVLVAFGIRYSIREEHKWLEYAAANCTVTGEISSSIATSFDGKALVIPGKTIYTCHGKTIIR